MIFVTVGTHEQPFDRLIKYVDQLKRENVITEDVVIQTGFSTYEPECCQWQKLYPYQMMLEMVESARIIITHGGPSSFILPLRIGKIPIVVPRQYQYKEHINNHQVDFARTVAERLGNIIVVENLEGLEHILIDYEAVTSKMTASTQSNNIYFNEQLEQMVNEMFRVVNGL